MSQELDRRLPIFRLATPDIDVARELPVLQLLNLADASPEQLPDGTIRIRQGFRSLEIGANGALWFADEEYLWNPAAPVDGLLALSTAHTSAVDLLREGNLLPSSSGGASVGAKVVAVAGTRTTLARMDDGGALRRGPCQPLDVFVGLGASMRIVHPLTDRMEEVAVLGQAGKAGVTYGPRGRIIGLNRGWRSIAGIVDQADVVIPAFESLAVREAWDREVTVDTANPRLVYRDDVLADGTSALCPYWLCKVFVEHGDRVVRSWDVLAPAARFDTLAPRGLPFDYAPRKANSQPAPSRNGYSIGTSWLTNGNPYAETEVGDVLRQALAERWNVGFAWRDKDALVTDWSAEAATWVDDVDLAYYAGHAEAYGWLLADDESEGETTDFLSPDATGRFRHPNAVWGQRLKWVMIGACGPLQDVCAPPRDADVFEWTGAFEGLHAIMGFASSTAGFTGEGGRALELARRGMPVAHAWLRAARENQPSVDILHVSGEALRWASVLVVDDARQGSTLLDHLPGHGLVSPRVGAPEGFRAIWSPC